jgi:ATP-binding protein involved in chromosome partitioning
LITKEAVENALRSVPDMGGAGDIVSRERVERIAVEGDLVTITLNLPTDNDELKAKIEGQSRQAIKAVGGVREVMIMVKGTPPERPQPAPSPLEERRPIEGVKNIVAVSSAKGGVGKSTVCVNLALALAAQGAQVGLMDADVYGPSLHVLLGVTDRPTEGRTKEIAPVVKHGMRLMSLGFLSDPSMPVIWRGPIVTGVVRKFLQDVEWGDLDYLMVDMPPGTGDTQLTLVQTVPITGALIVTTPSELALVDARKGLEMYRTVKSPVLGMVENMSYFVCPHCNERTDIFSHGGTREVAERLGTRFLGEIPIDSLVRSSGDEGDPIVRSDPDSAVSKAFFEIAGRLREACSTAE